MWMYRAAVMAAVLTVVACAGSERQNGDSETVRADTGIAAAANAASAEEGTGATHEVHMAGDEKGYRFEPAAITIKAGDQIRFLNVSGGPHNIAAEASKIPDDVEATLSANMPDQMSPLNGPLLINLNEAYTLSFAGIRPGTYELNCMPHLAMGMIIKVTVE